MTRRHLFGLPLALAAQSRRKPNVIVILADDLGSADVGFQGAKDIPTPHLDALARSGVRFTHACVSHPFCSPTRAGLITGRYQQRFGHENNPVYDPADTKSGLPLGETTLPQALAEAGYRTGIVGKWHLGASPHFHPLKRGFHEHFGFIGGGHQYFTAKSELPATEYLVPIERDGKPEPMPDGGYLTEMFSREAVRFIERNKSAPFFLYLAYNAPHTPLQVPPKYVERVAGIPSEKRRDYAAMTCAVDDGVGEVVKALKAAGIERDTLVFFLSDNGGPTNVTDASNGELRGQKGQVYEGGIRVPFVMAWPGRLPAAKVNGAPVIALDIFATACDAAGTPAGRIDGISLLGKLPEKRQLFWRTGGGTAWAVREGMWKLVVVNNRTELYDLSTDPGEKTDVSAANPGVRDRLEAARRKWDAELVAPVFLGPAARPAKPRPA